MQLSYKYTIGRYATNMWWLTCYHHTIGNWLLNVIFILYQHIIKKRCIPIKRTLNTISHVQGSVVCLTEMVTMTLRLQTSHSMCWVRRTTSSMFSLLLTSTICGRCKLMNHLVFRLFPVNISHSYICLNSKVLS